MSLTGLQVQQLQEVLLRAFNETALAQMVRIRLDENLAAVASGDNLGEIVFNLIAWAERTGRTDELIRGAAAHDLRNPELNRYAYQYFAAAGNQAPHRSETQSPITDDENLHAGDKRAGRNAGDRPVQQMDTQGGAYVAGNVTTSGGDFVGRDKIVHGDEVRGDKVWAIKRASAISARARVSLSDLVRRLPLPSSKFSRNRTFKIRTIAGLYAKWSVSTGLKAYLNILWIMKLPFGWVLPTDPVWLRIARGG